jgi:manganese transport protein
MAFMGPGYLVAVGYMDPGNWATDISGGSVYNYSLLSVVVLSSMMAMFLQALSAKLGIVTGRDLAQACHDTYDQRVGNFLWLSAEIGIIACDVAEVIGAGIALNLLFHIPLLLGCAVTGLDVLLVLALQGRGFRYIEALVIGLIAIMMAIFVIEMVYTKPEWNLALKSLIPNPDILRNKEMLYLSLGILGATIMPHNLYLHSSIIQTRRIGPERKDIKEAIKAAYTDSTIALTLAMFVNAAILLMAAAVFYRSGNHKIGDIESAYKLLTPLLGVSLAAPLFAIALLAAGQNSTLTGTMAGQIILEGFTKFRMKPWARRLVSRLLAIAPTLVVIYLFGQHGTQQLLVLSQVILSAQLSFAVIPLVQITSDRKKMGEFANGTFTKTIAWTMGIVILVLNVFLLIKAVVG